MPDYTPKTPSPATRAEEPRRTQVRARPFTAFSLRDGVDTLQTAMTRSPRVQALAQLQQSINNSRHVAVQRERMDALPGHAVRRPPEQEPQEPSRLGSLTIQRYFEAKGNMGSQWFWKDTDTGAIYWRDQTMRHGPLTMTGLPEWTFIRRKDGFELAIQSTGDPLRWELVGALDDEAEQFRMNPGSWKAPERVPRPKLIASDDYEMTVEESEPLKPSFVKGEKPSADFQAQAQEQIGGFHSTRIQNPLLAQFHLVPIEQGQQRSDLPEYAYPASAVAIAGVLIGDEDRTLVGTHLEPKKKGGATPQGRHTVAWALVRRSIGALTGRTLAHAFTHLKNELDTIVPFAASGEKSVVNEADFHLKRIGYPEGLDQIREARLPLDRWQANITEAVNVYIQLYHLCEGALFAGSSKQRGESDAAAAFALAERQLKSGLALSVGVSELATHANLLLDAPVRSLPPKTLAFVAHHWVMMLLSTWPTVMKQHGEAITKGFLGQDYVNSGFPTVTTVAELVAHFGHALPDWAMIEGPKETKGEEHLAPFTIETLKADFVANVNVFPLGEGQPADYGTKWGEKTISIQERKYPLAQMGLASVDVSDRDRPPTKFLGYGQKSHTVAWTLLRADLMAFGAGRMAALLSFLDTALKSLEGESKIDEGKELASMARKELAKRDSIQLTLFDWQNYASTMVKWYAHVYQAARSTSYADPRTQGRAEPHGEGPHMATLRRNEKNLHDFGVLCDEPGHVIAAAVALFDVCIPKTAEVDVSLEAVFMLAFDIWKQRLFHTFPKVTAGGWPSLYEAVSKVDVGLKMTELEMKVRSNDMIKRGYGIEHRLGVILKRNGRNA